MSERYKHKDIQSPFLEDSSHTKGSVYIEITVGDKYVTTLLEEQDMQNSRPVNSPGTAALKATDNEVPLAPDEHKLYRRAAGKPQWMTHPRPAICYATREEKGHGRWRSTSSQVAHKPEAGQHLANSVSPMNLSIEAAGEDATRFHGHPS